MVGMRKKRRYYCLYNPAVSVQYVHQMVNRDKNALFPSGELLDEIARFDNHAHSRAEHCSKLNSFYLIIKHFKKETMLFLIFHAIDILLSVDQISITIVLYSYSLVLISIQIMLNGYPCLCL